MEQETQGGRRAGMGKKWLPLLVAVVGVVLLLAANRLPQYTHAATDSTDRGGESVAEDELAIYTTTLTQQIEELCSCVEGAGQVRAAVSLQGGFTYLYAADSEQKSDGEGGEQSSESYITVGNGSSESAVLLTRVPPAVRGIGIVCQGGDDPAVRAEIISLLSAAYGVGSNRIYVTTAGK